MKTTVHIREALAWGPAPFRAFGSRTRLSGEGSHGACLLALLVSWALLVHSSHVSRAGETTASLIYWQWQRKFPDSCGPGYWLLETGASLEICLCLIPGTLVLGFNCDSLTA